MTNTEEETVKKIDIKKRILEINSVPSIKSVFNNFANDCQILYEETGNISQNLAINYKPDFIFNIKTIYRKTIKHFGFDLRKNVEKKYFVNFDTEYRSLFFDIELKQDITINDIQLDDKINSINNKFQQRASLFTSNQTNIETDYITETNQEMILSAITVGTALYNNKTKELQDQVTEGKIKPEKLDKHIADKNRYIAKQIKKDIKRKIQTRSELIVENAVGTAEAWSRQNEAEIIDEALLTVSQDTVLKIKKKWVSVLDDKTRESHILIDGEVVDLKDNFIVGGYPAKTPRDSNLPAKEKLRCRCQALYMQ